MTTADAQATFCATLVDEWFRSGVRHAVVCPGSRSTPLALALAADDRIRLQVHHDERSAGFLALGIGLTSGRPAVVLTTSGTAAAELLPSVVEAHHADIPLLVCTADRPPELHDVGAPQTIDQTHLYGPAVRWYHDPGVASPSATSGWRPLAGRCIVAATGLRPGPVHLNLPCRDPLVAPAGLPPPGRSGDRAWLNGPSHPEVAPDEVDALASAVRGRPGVIVAGGAAGEPAGVHALAAALGWPVLADPRSRCRLPEVATIAHFDALLRVPSFADSHRPEVVLRLGALPASKVLGQWLATLDAWQIGVERSGRVFDPDGSLTSLIAADPSALCGAVAARLGQPGPDDGGWLGSWAAADAEAASAIRSTLATESALSEPAIARQVLAALPDRSNLVVSSSMPVRDLEWYAAPREGVTVHANRGANGIDGVVSTAVGVAIGSGRPTAVLVGDVAMLHDTNALIGITRRGVDLTVVVIDNDGGGIFEFLPQATELDRDRFERLFGTPHGSDLLGLAAAHGVDATDIASPGDLAPAVRTHLATGGVHLLRARTDRRANVEAHDALHRAVAAALAARVPPGG